MLLDLTLQYIVSSEFSILLHVHRGWVCRAWVLSVLTYLISLIFFLLHKPSFLSSRSVWKECLTVITLLLNLHTPQFIIMYLIFPYLISWNLIVLYYGQFFLFFFRKQQNELHGFGYSLWTKFLQVKCNFLGSNCLAILPRASSVLHLWAVHFYFKLDNENPLKKPSTFHGFTIKKNYEIFICFDLMLLIL